MDPVWEGVYWATGGWTPSQGMVDYSAGFGDGLTGGITNWIRDQSGTNDAVSKCSDSYNAGKWSGAAYAVAMGGAYMARPYWRYVGPESNPNSVWMTRGWRPPYGKDMAMAKDRLQLPNMPTSVQKQSVPWSQPVRGPRPARGNEQWGSGGGPEYARGWRWP